METLLCQLLDCLFLVESALTLIVDSKLDVFRVFVFYCEWFRVLSVRISVDKNVIVFGWGHKLPKGSLYSLSYRAFYTLVRQVQLHNKVQVLRDRDDLLLVFLPCGFQRKLQVHGVLLQRGDVVVGW